MKTSLLAGLAVLLWSASSQAQIRSYPMMAKWISGPSQGQTARMAGLGGNFQAIGADPSNITGNPAGLGYYQRSELSLSAGFTQTQVNAQYLGQSNNQDQQRLWLPNANLILAGEPSRTGEWLGSFGVAYARQQWLDLPFSIQGSNNRSSILDQFIETANANGATGQSLDDLYYPALNAADSPEAVAYQTYLINPSANGGAPFTRFEKGNTVNQSGVASNSGFQSQWSFAYGASYLKKLYLGLSMHFLRFRQNAQFDWDEQFQNANNVQGFLYRERLATSGSGIQLQLGLIYHLKPNLRMAVSFQSPGYFDQISERFSGGLSPRVFSIPTFDGNGKPIELGPNDVKAINLNVNDFTYSLRTPMKVGGGLAYFFGKKGFLSVDLEMVNYGGMHLSSGELSPMERVRFENYRNGQIKSYFESALNVKVGGEWRLMPKLTLRGGYARFDDGYKSNFDPIDRGIQQFSLGLGYRVQAYYLDLSAQHRSWKDAYTPYELKDPSAYASASLKFQQTQIILSTGVYF